MTVGNKATRSQRSMVNMFRRNMFVEELSPCRRFEDPSICYNNYAWSDPSPASALRQPRESPFIDFGRWLRSVKIGYYAHTGGLGM
mmetsp:Transcript_38966/g.96802  ORF Transcript_38966/g.96802 Transcript_38966/m.96802 type:complete len:86 (-) Transcript_38966:60-317(-)